MIPMILFGWFFCAGPVTHNFAWLKNCGIRRIIIVFLERLLTDYISIFMWSICEHNLIPIKKIEKCYILELPIKKYYILELPIKHTAIVQIKVFNAKIFKQIILWKL